MCSSLWLQRSQRPYRLSRGWEVVMTKELLIALGLPTAYLVLTTVLLAGRHQRLPRFLLRLTARDALLWNTVLGLMIAVAALRWALSR